MTAALEWACLSLISRLSLLLVRTTACRSTLASTQLSLFNRYPPLISTQLSLSSIDLTLILLSRFDLIALPLLLAFDFSFVAIAFHWNPC